MPVVSSEKGLCGGYNAQLFKKIKQTISNTDEELEFVFIGKKVQSLLKREMDFEINKYEFEIVNKNKTSSSSFWYGEK